MNSFSFLPFSAHLLSTCQKGKGWFIVTQKTSTVKNHRTRPVHASSCVFLERLFSLWVQLSLCALRFSPCLPPFGVVIIIMIIIIIMIVIITIVVVVVSVTIDIVFVILLILVIIFSIIIAINTTIISAVEGWSTDSSRLVLCLAVVHTGLIVAALA